MLSKLMQICGAEDLVQAKQDLEEATAALAEAPGSDAAETAEPEPPNGILAESADAPMATAGQLVMDKDTDMPEEPTLHRVMQPFLEREHFQVCATEPHANIVLRMNAAGSILDHGSSQQPTARLETSARASGGALVGRVHR